MKNFKNIVSFGYFCSVAIDLEKMGLRDFSSPFDWCLVDLEGAVSCLNEKFIDLFNPEYLSQSTKNRHHYYNEKYKIWFFHDFNRYQSLDEQILSVKEKYDRRVKRFFEKICEPTLFIRYISSEDGDNSEGKYLEENYEQIVSSIRKFNPENDIIFISDNGLQSDKCKIYNVQKDEGDIVSRSPLFNNKELFKFLSDIPHDAKEKNLIRYRRKRNKETFLRPFKAIKNKTNKFIKKLFSKEYIHSKLKEENN